jgi:hypothetical protein
MRNEVPCPAISAGHRGGNKQKPMLYSITVDKAVYEGLHQVVGRRKISQFIEDLVRPYVIGIDLEAGYTAMAADEAREAEAAEWVDAISEDTADEMR